MTMRISTPAQLAAALAHSEAFWPPQKVETLRFYVEAGMHSFTEIATIMGITKNAAIGKSQRLGLKGPRTAKGPSTIFERMNALHAEMDAILAAPRPKPAVAAKATDNATRPVERRRSA